MSLQFYIWTVCCLGSYYYVQKEVCCEDPIVDILCVLTVVSLHLLSRSCGK